MAPQKASSFEQAHLLTCPAPGFRPQGTQSTDNVTTPNANQAVRDLRQLHLDVSDSVPLQGQGLQMVSDCIPISSHCANPDQKQDEFI
jgi:hypothetical protein